MILSGETLRLSIEGGSHTKEIGMTLSGIPSGIKIDEKKAGEFLSRRAPGKNEYSSARKETDEPRFLSGLANGVTNGDTIKAVIENRDIKPGDYEKYKTVPRPGHADYTAFLKYGKDYDISGGGAFSGRMTAPLCIAGAVCSQILEEKGVKILSRVASVGLAHDSGELTSSTAHKDFPVTDDSAAKKMKEEILKAKSEGNSVGGVVEIAVIGLPAGLGGPMFSGVESRISSAVFGIPAVKGIEFGAGFKSAALTGKENNDGFFFENGRVITKTNNAGGVLGGITNGMPLTFKVAFKPTPSIAIEQNSVDLESKTNTRIKVTGRHDPCVAVRAVPAVESAAAVVLLDMILSEGKGT